MSLSGLVPLTLQATAQQGPVLLPSSIPSQTTPKDATPVKALDRNALGPILSFLSNKEIFSARTVCRAWSELPLLNKDCLALSGLPKAQPASPAHLTAVIESQPAPKQATTNIIKAIPNDVFGRILSFLPAKQITTCLHHVCKDWRNLSLVNDGCLDLSGVRDFTDSALKTILDKASGTRITSIHLPKCLTLTDAGFAHLSKLTSLSSLNLYFTDITDAGLAYLSNTSLSSLNLSWCNNITNRGLAHLSKLTSLRSLDLYNTRITDAGLAHLSNTSLSSLNLERCNIKDAGLAHLETLTSLSSLNLKFINITDAGLAYLSKLTSLSSLNLCGCSYIRGAGLAHLSKLTRLSSLDLSCCRNITDAGLAHLATLTSLSSLDLSCCRNITDAGLAHLSKLTLLSSLQLDHSGITLDTAKAFQAKLSIQR